MQQKKSLKQDYQPKRESITPLFSSQFSQLSYNEEEKKFFFEGFPIDKIRVFGLITHKENVNNLSVITIEDDTGSLEITVLKKYGEDEAEIMSHIDKSFKIPVECICIPLSYQKDNDKKIQLKAMKFRNIREENYKKFFQAEAELASRFRAGTLKQFDVNFYSANQKRNTIEDSSKKSLDNNSYQNIMQNLFGYIANQSRERVDVSYDDIKSYFHSTDERTLNQMLNLLESDGKIYRNPGFNSFQAFY